MLTTHVFDIPTVSVPPQRPPPTKQAEAQRKYRSVTRGSCYQRTNKQQKKASCEQAPEEFGSNYSSSVQSSDYYGVDSFRNTVEMSGCHRLVETLVTIAD
ncbi:hypothetical protein VKT23_015127 [Stygiomarasmius scandens]|uniref:Uncharacterized protein n=1 Tax=Marasmiellus scandens TaxID=2682957 RepID=A0ABR1IYK2_9AGAR